MIPISNTICLTTDETNFLNPKIGFFIPGFIPSVPKNEIPKVIRYALEKLLFYDIPHKDGEVYHCIYGLRKIEAILLNAGLNCKVFSPQVIEKYIDDISVFGIYSMDPLGLGPVTATLQGVFGHRRYNIYGDEKYYEPPYTVLKFRELINKLREFDKPIIVGGPGTCQFDLLPGSQEELGIDCVVIGDAELIAPDLFRKAMRGESLPKVVRSERISTEVEIPTIKKPASWGLIEISRGCDRRCKFCDPTLKAFRWIPESNIIKEAKINLKFGTEICLMSEDVFRYGAKPRQWTPNWGLVNLIRKLKELPNLESISLSHACLASALAAPEQIEALKEELNLSKENYTSVQVGVETGAIHLIKEFMPYKAAPFEPEQWHDVVVDGWRLLAKNYIYPAATLMIGLDDSEEDIQETISLMKKIMKYPGMFFPLFFSSLGTLKQKHRFFVDWTQMSPSAQELYVLAIKYMTNQSEKMHEHLFGTSLIYRLFNHFVAIVGRSIIDSVETKIWEKGHLKYGKFGKVVLKNFVQYARKHLSLHDYKARFHGKIKS
ncbi:MAG: B12-binding domain-containing radical SAM protein [Promethearchaeota archaeon]